MNVLEQLWSVGLLNKRTHARLRLMVWGRDRADAEAKLDGVLFGDGCEYDLRNTIPEPAIGDGKPVNRYVEVNGNA